MACEYSQSTTGRASTALAAICAAARGTGYMGHWMSVSDVRPVPHMSAPPASYCTGRDASSARTAAWARARFTPSPASFPRDQMMMEAWLRWDCTMRTERST